MTRVKALQRAHKLLLPGAFLVLGLWFTAYHVLYPQPFYSFFSDPELPYILNSVQLAQSGTVQMHEHPGTLLQIAGAVISRIIQMEPASVFSSEKIDMFRLFWRVVSLFAAAITLLVLYRMERSLQSSGLFGIALLLIVSDYNALAYWGTFTPEGAFFAVYLPTALLFIHRHSLSAPVRIPELAGWAFLLGSVSTIKITLLPASLFLWVAGYSITVGRQGSLNLRIGAFRPLLGSALTLLIFGLLAVGFSEDRSAQLQWFAQLVSEGGRYGRPTESGGMFLPAMEIIDWVIKGLSLQSYTTLVPLTVLVAISVFCVIGKSVPRNQKVVSAAFILVALANWLIFIKHPYQIKYLLTQPILLVVFWCAWNQCCGKLSVRAMAVTSLLLCFVAFNSFANHLLLHRYTRERTLANAEIIDRIVASKQPSTLYVGSNLDHPVAAKRFAVNWARYFRANFAEQVGTVHSVNERSFDLRQTRGGSSIGIAAIEPDSLIIVEHFYRDDRIIPQFESMEMGLFIYSPR